jgi:5-hydroxyisourate hydrolase-like protein (transthyretin family)
VGNPGFDFNNIPLIAGGMYKMCAWSEMASGSITGVIDLGNNYYPQGFFQRLAGDDMTFWYYEDNSSIVDTTPPTITPVYPTNAQVLNYNGTLYFTTNENANCSVNNTQWVRNNTNGGTAQLYYNTNTLTDGIYKLNLSCGDASNNNASNILNFTNDKTPPIIISTINNSYHSGNRELYFNVTDINNIKNITFFDNCSLNYTNTSVINPFTYLQNLSVINCGMGQKTLNITSCDNSNNCVTQIYIYNVMAQLNITAKEEMTNTQINTFSIYKNGVLSGSTTNGIYILNNISINYYNITIDAVDYELNTTQYYINNSYQNITFHLYKTNSIRITVRNEGTNLIINGTNISLEMTLDTNLLQYSTQNGTFYIYNLTAGEWNAKFTATGYSTRLYSLTIGNRTSQFLNAYLTESESTTIFTIRNDETNDLVQDVSISMYRILNGTWAVIESKNSDITGRAQFIYETDVNYRFYLSKSGYDDLLFYLNPILLESYDIRIQPQITINNSADFDSVSIIYSPSLYYSGLNTFNFLIQSPNGNLESYGYNISYPGGSDTQTGTNALGSQLTSAITITPTSITDIVTIKYYYDITTQDRKDFTVNFAIVSNTSNNYTMMENKNKTYGMGVFERTLIMVIFIIFVVGVATLIGRPIIGMALGGFVMAYFMYIGFIEWWLGALPILMIFLMLGFRGNSQ